MSKSNLEQEINEFLKYWDCQKMHDFLYDIMPLVELYDVEEDEDWVSDAFGEDEARNIRLIRTVYLISRIASFHAGSLALIKANFKDIHRRMEKIGMVEVEQ